MSTRHDPQASDHNGPAPATGADAPKDPVPAKDPKAKDNDYSPDFKSEPEPKTHTDADIDTQGG